MKIKEDAEHPEEREWAERYVVSWIEAEVDDDERHERRSSSAGGGVGAGPGTGPGTGAATPEGRRSFGSDSPRIAPAGTAGSTRAQTPTTMHRRSSSGGGSVRMQGTLPRRKPATTPTTPVTAKRRERQLVVITYAGDWYRLRLPPAPEAGEERKTQCELVEYRRIGIGGCGW